MSVFEGCGDILPRNDGRLPAESETVRHGSYFRGQAVHTDGQRQSGRKAGSLNPKVEVCAMKGDGWIRIEGTLVLDDRVGAQESMLDDYPSLRKMYTTGPDGNTAVYYFKDATATIYSFSHEPVVIKF